MHPLCEGSRVRADAPMDERYTARGTPDLRGGRLFACGRIATSQLRTRSRRADLGADPLIAQFSISTEHRAARRQRAFMVSAPTFTSKLFGEISANQEPRQV